MLLLTYCAINDDTIERSLGDAEYSYFFVYRQFLNVLKKAHFVIPVVGSVEKLDPYYQDCLARGEECFCLFFSQPHKIPTHLSCPIIPVFAWEYDSLPKDANNRMDQDWGWRLAKHGWAITHSNYSAKCVKERIRSDFPVISIPSPVWDKYQHFFLKKHRSSGHPFSLHSRGTFIDSDALDVERLKIDDWQSSLKGLMASVTHSENNTVSIEGVVYLSVFNPYDRRKNWQDMLRAFCWEFKQTTDATLILKISHKDSDKLFPLFLKELYKLSPFSCRVLIIHGYLHEKFYSALIKNCDYVVNSSHGEGQCLPLMEGMSAGKPAISPDHTAMKDYLSPANSFIVKSSPEPTFWPHDPRQRLRALHYRINWKSLCAAFRQSYRKIKEEPDAYQKMSHCAYKAMEHNCSERVVLRKISHFLKKRKNDYRSFDRAWQARPDSLNVRIRRRLRPVKRRFIKPKPY